MPGHASRILRRPRRLPLHARAQRGDARRISGELTRLDVLLADPRVDVGALARHLADLARVEWAQTTALLLPDADDIPDWLKRT